jgi:hypothetical protein
MRSGIFAALILLAFFPASPAAQEKDDKGEHLISWAYLRAASEIRSKPASNKRGLMQLGQGWLVPVLKTESKNGVEWARTRVLNLSKLTAQVGWIDSGQVEILPAEQFPEDAELLRRLGGEYLDDFAATHAAIARFLVRQEKAQRTLVCFIVSTLLPIARLVAFRTVRDKLVPGPTLEFPASELQGGITALEVRDLLGDGNECLVTHEPFRQGLENGGVNLVIRRIAGGSFETLWKAPLDYRHLDSFPPRPRVLRPPESNVGAPGTVTKGEVDFKTRGNLQEPFWKGNVKFYVVGREEPVDSVTIEKVCRWDGTKFEPLR